VYTTNVLTPDTRKEDDLDHDKSVRRRKWAKALL
jgi:hypothetical protein